MNSRLEEMEELANLLAQRIKEEYSVELPVRLSKTTSQRFGLMVLVGILDPSESHLVNLFEVYEDSKGNVYWDYHNGHIRENMQEKVIN